MEDVVYHKYPYLTRSSSQKRVRASEPSVPASSINSDKYLTVRGPITELIDWFNRFKAAFEVFIYKNGVDNKEMSNKRLI